MHAMQHASMPMDAAMHAAEMGKGLLTKLHDARCRQSDLSCALFSTQQCVADWLVGWWLPLAVVDIQWA